MSESLGSNSNTDHDDEMSVEDIPWTDEDLNGVLDYQVVTLYRISKTAYPLASSGLQIGLNSIMTAISSSKPNSNTICTRNPAELITWLKIINDCESILPDGLLSYAGIASSLLENAIEIAQSNIQDDTHGTDVDVPPYGEDSTIGIDSKLAIQ